MVKTKTKKAPAAKSAPEKTGKKKQPGESQIKKQPFLKRMLFGEEKPDLSELEAGSTTILDILSPTTVDTKSRDYIIVDDVYHAYLYITGYGYTTTVGTCWLAPLVEAGEGINLSFLVKRQPKEKILSKIAQTTMVNRSRMRDVGDTRQDYEELDSAISSGLYLKDVMNRQGENFYYMHTLIEVTASDPETLEQRVTEVEKLCVSVDMIARRCDYKNEQAFLSALPILALDPDIERKARRNALTSGVAAAFPFVSYELSDHDGIFLGLNLYNRSPVFLNPYDDYKYTSGNWWIGGSTGAGKTVTLQCLGGRLREQGKRVIIIVPKKGHEFRPLCERLGGLYLRMSPSSKDCPNLMAIRRKSLDSYAKLKNIAARDDSVLADKIAQLIIWFSLKKKDLNEEDKSRLDSSLVEVYKRYGITFDNSTIVDENGDFRTMPILSDWYEILYQEQDTRHLAVVLSRYVTGSAAAMAGRNDIELNNKYIVLDLSGMPDDMIADGTFWATSIAYDLIMNCEDELSVLLADELWSLVGATANPQAAGFVLEMVKTIRGLGGIAVTSTQGMQVYLQMIETDEDKSKFEEIYQEYRNLMYYVAYKRMQHEQDAEDVVHHVFVKIAENIKNIEPVSPKTKQLIVTMVDNRVTDVFRVRGKHPVVMYDDELKNSPVTENEREDLLTECILKLPEQQRMVIWMKYKQGYSLREIAKALDISLVWAQKIDQRTKKKLEELYLEGGGIL